MYSYKGNKWCSYSLNPPLTARCGLEVVRPDQMYMILGHFYMIFISFEVKPAGILSRVKVQQHHLGYESAASLDGHVIKADTSSQAATVWDAV